MLLATFHRVVSIADQIFGVYRKGWKNKNKKNEFFCNFMPSLNVLLPKAKHRNQNP
jgi:hypothetical protein